MDAIEKRFEAKPLEFKQKLFDASVLYCVRSLSAFAYQRRLTSIFRKYKCNESVKEFRMEISSNSGFLLNLKFFCLSFVKNKLWLAKNESLLDNCLAEYKIEAIDYEEFERFFAKKINKASLNSAFETYTKKNIVTVEQIKAQFYSMFQDIQKYCKIITYKKLSFIIRSNNLSNEDFHCELMTKAIRAYYSLLPTNQTDLYILNYVKRAVHNHAMNIIKQYTFGKRDRLKSFNGNSEFVLSVVSENQFRPINNEGEYSSFDDFGGLVDESYNAFEVKRTYHQLYKRHKGRARRLLKLILGEYDADFTDHLQKIKVITRNRDNVSFYDSDIDQYKQQAFEFLKIDQDKGNRFLKTLYTQNFGV